MKISPEELLLYASGELPPERQAHCEQLLRQDPESRRALEELMDQNRQLEHLPLLQPSRDLVAPAMAAAARPRFRLSFIFSPPLLAAAALLLLLGATGLFFRFRPPALRMAKQPATPLETIPREEDIDARIASLRQSFDSAYRPPALASATGSPEEESFTSVRDRLETLQENCRPQWTSTLAAPAADSIDSRMRSLKSRLATARGDLQDIEISGTRPTSLSTDFSARTIIGIPAGYPCSEAAVPPVVGPRAGFDPKQIAAPRRTS